MIASSGCARCSSASWRRALTEVPRTRASSSSTSKRKILSLSISLPLVRFISRARVQPVQTGMSSRLNSKLQGDITMRVMVIIKANKESEAGVLPDEKLLTEMGRYNEELVKAGVMLAGEGLHPSSKGKRVKFSGGNVSVIDGPFAEAKELIAGFWLWQVKSKDEAIEWVKRCPNPL